MRKPLALFALTFLLLAGDMRALRAETATKINARAGEHPDFDRIVFDWPRTVTYHMTRDGNQVTLTFAAPANVQFNGFTHLSRAKRFSSTEDKNGNLTISFAVAPQAVVHDFTSDHSVAVDIKGPNVDGPIVLEPTSKTEPVKEPAKEPFKQEAATAKPAAPPAPAIAEPAHAAPIPNKTAPLPVTPPVTPIKPDTALTTAKNLVPLTDVSKDDVQKMAPKTPALNASVKQDGTSSAAKPAPPLNVGEAPLLVAAMDPRVETRAVVWQRGGYAYILFDRKLTLTLDALTAGQVAPRTTLDPLDIMKASGYRFPVADDIAIRATREGTVWKIFASKQQPDIPVSTTLVAQPDFALGARLLLPLPDAPDPVRFTDPVVGDDLVLVPLNQTEAFAVARRLADFAIIPAAQGLVIKPLTDKLIVRAVSDGIEITAEGGLRLSTASDTGASQQSTQKAKAAAAGKSLFDFAAWQGKPDETFTQTRQRLQQTIVDVPERERNRARLELARFYFAHGEGNESLALLGMLAQQVPDLAMHGDFLALDAASKILAYRPDEGLKEMDSPLLTGQPEIELWQAVGQAELRNWGDAEEKFAISESILIGYPEPFYSRFLVLAIESAVASNKDHEAADWLDRLETGPHEEDAKPAIAYLHGVLHAKAGRAQAAEDSWKEVAASNNHLYKIRAELALIDLGVANGSLTAAQAADRLEALRFGWRGDDLEVDILHRLGQFYVQAKNVRSGLSALSQAVQLYPTSPITPKIKIEMAQIFHDVFLGELGKKLSPLDALTLYQQYRNLMPPGADGIAVTRNLAERLVAIDLLEQAGDLLEDLVKNKLQGEEKGHASARLAAVRLLDHKPEQALTALTLSDGEFFPAELQHERLLLRAKALSDLHRDDEALALLGNNPRESAKLLRADITMHAQHWSDAAAVLLDLAGSPPKPGEILHNDQADWLVNCAIAYSLAGDQAGLDKLAIDYSAAMSGTPQSDTFRLLTQPEKEGQLKDIAAAQARISDVNLFQGFLDGYRKTSGAEAAPATEAGTKSATPEKKP